MLLSFLATTALFQGISQSELERMLPCLDATIATFDKGAYLYHSGDVTRRIGMVLSGGVMIESDDLWGNRSIIGHVEAGAIFAETYACIPDEPMLVNVVAVQKTEALFLSAEKLLRACPHACDCHGRLIQNLLRLSAQKNLHLSRRILYTSSKTIRGRLMTYFSDLVKQSGSRSFTIPFDRQQLADYLGLDRSALCHELSKMQRDGLLTYRKNAFTLLGDLP